MQRLRDVLGIPNQHCSSGKTEDEAPIRQVSLSEALGNMSEQSDSAYLRSRKRRSRSCVRRRLWALVCDDSSDDQTPQFKHHSTPFTNPLVSLNPSRRSHLMTVHQLDRSDFSSALLVSLELVASAHLADQRCAPISVCRKRLHVAPKEYISPCTTFPLSSLAAANLDKPPICQTRCKLIAFGQPQERMEFQHSRTSSH